jgi:hypothetical protein
MALNIFFTSDRVTPLQSLDWKLSYSLMCWLMRLDLSFICFVSRNYHFICQGNVRRFSSWIGCYSYVDTPWQTTDYSSSTNTRTKDWMVSTHRIVDKLSVVDKACQQKWQYLSKILGIKSRVSWFNWFPFLIRQLFSYKVFLDHSYLTFLSNYLNEVWEYTYYRRTHAIRSA